eukprot:GHVS01059685.1.p1 GENE.GHVS01059685.1~~GHVS01059685.1.p1  ORF type:complete len:357 (-),score=29.47 GHVS01059685.1:979-2049(-)
MDDHDELEEEEEYEFEDDDNHLNSSKKQLPVCVTVPKPYDVLSEADVEQRIQEATNEVAELLMIDTDIVLFLLRAYRWNADELTQDWFTNPAAVYKRGGLPEQSSSPESSFTLEEGKEEFTCPVLCETVPIEQSFALRCGHRYSHECWRRYLKAAVEEGPDRALTRRCPHFECRELVRSSCWSDFSDPALHKRYKHFRVCSYIDSHPLSRWCPAPDCGRAVQLRSIITADGRSSSEAACCGVGSVIRTAGQKGDVKCDCGRRFCVLCGGEPHWPVPCEIIQKWHEKNASDADSMDWIIVHTKNCPCCKQRIEKNHGCMHMTCRCGFEFCWLCLGDWKKHNTVFLLMRTARRATCIG